MKKIAVVLAAVIAVAAPTWAGAPRVLEGSVDAERLDKVKLDAGVGDIEVVADGDAADVTVSVELKPRRGGFFSSMKA